MTKRTKLREFAREDIKELKSLIEESPEVISFMGVGNVKNTQIDGLLDAYIDNQYRFYGYGMWGIYENKTGSLIGMAGLCNTDGGVELGYMIKQSKQRQGFATEVCRFILDEICDYLALDRVVCVIKSCNTASIRLAEKLQRHNGILEIIKVD